MANIKALHIGETHGKWGRLLQYFQSPSTNTVFRCVFPTKEAARTAKYSLASTIKRTPGSLPLLLVQKGCEMYVIKIVHAQEVLIHHD